MAHVAFYFVLIMMFLYTLDLIMICEIDVSDI